MERLVQNYNKFHHFESDSISGATALIITKGGPALYGRFWMFVECLLREGGVSIDIPKHDSDEEHKSKYNDMMELVKIGVFKKIDDSITYYSPWLNKRMEKDFKRSESARKSANARHHGSKTPVKKKAEKPDNKPQKVSFGKPATMVDFNATPKAIDFGSTAQKEESESQSDMSGYNLKDKSVIFRDQYWMEYREKIKEMLPDRPYSFIDEQREKFKKKYKMTRPESIKSWHRKFLNWIKKSYDPYIPDVDTSEIMSLVQSEYEYFARSNQIHFVQDNKYILGIQKLSKWVETYPNNQGMAVLKAVFAAWHNLKDFHRNRVQPSDIANQMVNIIQELKGHINAKREPTREDFRKFGSQAG